MRLVDVDKLYYEDVECTDGNTYSVVHALEIDNADIFDLANHDSELLDKVVEKFKENINTILDEPNYQHEGETWQNGLIIASDSLDEVIEELKAEIQKVR